MAKQKSAATVRERGFDAAVNEAPAEMQASSQSIRACLDFVVVALIVMVAIAVISHDKKFSIAKVIYDYFPREAATIMGELNPQGGGAVDELGQSEAAMHGGVSLESIDIVSGSGSDEL